MDAFRESITNREYVNTFRIGAVYGLFLVFAQAWAEFLKQVILEITPNGSEENMVVGAGIYAFSATVTSIIILAFII